MKRVAPWLGRTVVMLALLYAFMVLGAALWLRRHLAPESLTATTGCYGRNDSMQKYERSRARRDSLVLYLTVHTPGAEIRGPMRLFRNAAIDHVYVTWWPTGERDRLYAEMAPGLRRCAAPPKFS